MNIFVENQPVKSPLVWIVVGPLLTAVCFALARIEYLSLQGALAVSVMSMLVIVVSVTLTSLTLSVVVTDKDVRVRLFPFTFIGTKIERSNIESVQVQELSSYDDLGKSRLQPLENTFQMFVLNGDDLLRIRTREGKDVLIGTLHPNALGKAVDAIRVRSQREELLLAEH